MMTNLIVGAIGWAISAAVLTLVAGLILHGYQAVHRECPRCHAQWYGERARWPIWILTHQCQ